MTEEKKTAESISAALDLTSFFGVKAGMTRIFDEAGNHIPVTVIKLIPNYVTQVKTVEKDGYEAYQVGYAEKREALVKKPMKGHSAKATTANVTRFTEIRTENVDTENLGKELGLGAFEINSYVDVIGTSKGKGFQGVMKKYNFAGGPAAHGSHFHRTGGSIGNRATPGRVFKLKKMPGQMGDKQKTIQNIQVVEVNQDKGYMLLRGSVPGAKNGFLTISTALKK